MSDDIRERMRQRLEAPTDEDSDLSVLEKMKEREFVPFKLKAGELRAMCEGQTTEIAKIKRKSVARFPDDQVVHIHKAEMEALLEGCETEQYETIDKESGRPIIHTRMVPKSKKKDGPTVDDSPIAADPKPVKK